VNGAPPVLELRGHEGLRRREVLRGIDLAVGEHRAVALIGASGSGKSTLLRCVDLLDEIDEGDVFLDGEVITDPSRRPVAVRRRLGLVFQAYNLFPHLTVLQNVVLAPVRAHGMPRAEARERARELLARFGLAGREGADEVCFLHEGRILERGEPERIFRDPRQPETRQFLRRVLEPGRL
jgi:polar amino acid transport system ATP-binding protein